MAYESWDPDDADSIFNRKAAPAPRPIYWDNARPEPDCNAGIHEYGRVDDCIRCVHCEKLQGRNDF